MAADRNSGGRMGYGDRGDVTGAEFHADPDGTEGAASHDVLQGIVPEQAEVAGAAAGGLSLIHI